MDLEDILKEGSDDSDVDISAVNIQELLDENDNDDEPYFTEKKIATHISIDSSISETKIVTETNNNPIISFELPIDYLINGTNNSENKADDYIKNYTFDIKNAKYSSHISSYDIDDNKKCNVSPVSNKLESLLVAERRELKLQNQGLQDSVSILNFNRDKPINNFTHKRLDSSHSNLKFIDFSKISDQLRRNTNFKQQGPGVATVIEISSKFIAIGTSKGLVLLFDHAQEIRQVIGSAVPATNRCSDKVTAISINNGGTLILVGYTTGEITLWDIKGSLLKTITDLHHASITTLRFVVNILDGSKLNATLNTNIDAVSVDAKGVVQKIQLSKHLLWSTYTYEANCLLDGAIGLVSSMSPLISIYDKYCHQNTNKGNRQEIVISQISKDNGFGLDAASPNIGCWT